MNNKSIILLLLSCVTWQSSYAEFQSQDPRALGMGGVGTAAANSAQAHFYNPSLLANAKNEENFNLELPGTARVADPDNLVDDFADFADGQYITSFTDALVDINNAIESNKVDLVQLAEDLIDASKNLQDGFNDLSGKSFIANGNAGIVASSPNGKIGWAAYLNIWGDAGARFNLGENDNAAMTNIINIGEDIVNGTVPQDIIIDPIDTLDSTFSIDTLVVREFGVSLASNYGINNYDFDIGVTPKIMLIDAYSYTQSLEQAEENDGEIDLGEFKNYTSFNFDIGISKQLNENWKSGIVVKNLFPQSFKSPTNNGRDLKISPAVRIGTVYQYNWAVIAADLDLTKNSGPASDSNSQYLSIGTELNLWLLKLRLGLKSNLAAKDNNTFSVGLGFHLWALNVDAAIAAGEGKNGTNDGSAALQVGLQW